MLSALSMQLVCTEKANETSEEKRHLLAELLVKELQPDSNHRNADAGMHYSDHAEKSHLFSICNNKAGNALREKLQALITNNPNEITQVAYDQEPGYTKKDDASHKATCERGDFYVTDGLMYCRMNPKRASAVSALSICETGDDVKAFHALSKIIELREKKQPFVPTFKAYKEAGCCSFFMPEAAYREMDGFYKLTLMFFERTDFEFAVSHILDQSLAALKYVKTPQGNYFQINNNEAGRAFKEDILRESKQEGSTIRLLTSHHYSAENRVSSYPDIFADECYTDDIMDCKFFSDSTSDAQVLGTLSIRSGFSDQVRDLYGFIRRMHNLHRRICQAEVQQQEEGRPSTSRPGA